MSSVVVVMSVLLVLIERCGRWHERRRRPAWRIDAGGIGGGSGCVASCSRASYEYALETAHVDQVYGESPPATAASRDAQME